MSKARDTSLAGKRRSIILGGGLLLLVLLAISSVLASATVTSDPNAFQTAIAGLGTPTTVNFDDIDASPVNNSTAGRTPFNGSFYAGQGISLASPNGVPLFIAPGGLFWNASNSLSVSNFPFEAGSDTNDSLAVTLNPPAAAVGFTLVDNGSQRPDEFVQFLDSDGAVVQQVGLPPNFGPFRAFIGIVSVDRPIARINIAEAANDGDDVDYDDFIFVPSHPIITVAIDIKPGSFPNSINPRNNGVIPVAILTTPTFDAATVDPATVRFGFAQAPAVQFAQEDVDNDGDVDLVLHFNTQDTGIKCGDTQSTLTGKTFTDDFITGADSVATAGCKPLQIAVKDVGPEIGIAFGLEGFIINPQDTNNLLGSTGRVGVFKSLDGGLNWSTSNNGLTDSQGLVANAANIRRDPSNPFTVYSPTATDGLYRSNNFGDTWSSIGGLDLVNPTLSDCAVHPTSPNVIYALAQFAEHPDLPGPLFKSTDGGSTFAETGGLPDLDSATNVAIAPPNPNVVYVLDSGTFEGVYKSIDGGSSFARLASSPSQPFTLFPHPAQANTLLLVANSGSTGLFRSTDGGVTFVQVATGLPAGKLNNTVAYDPANPSIVYVGGMGGIFRSTDGGATFASFGRFTQDDLGFFGVNAISIDPTNAKVIYVSTSKGNFKTVNGGSSFVAINRGWRATQVNYLTFDNHSSPGLYAGVFNTVGILRTNNRGNNYEIIGEKLPDIQVSSLAVAAAGRDFIVAATFSGIFRSTDGGRSWTQAAIDTGQTIFGTSRVAIDPSNPNNVYAVTANGPFSGSYRSTDGGGTFARSNTGLTETRLGTLAIDPNNPNVVYVGAFNGNRGVFKSTNGGLSFSATGQTNGNLSEIVIDPKNSQAIYISTRGGSSRVRRSLDGGVTFTAVDNGLSGNGVRGLVIDPVNPSRLFVWIRSGGVFLSEDGANSWAVIDAGETLRRSKPGRGTMAIDPKNPNLIYVGSASILEIEIKP